MKFVFNKNARNEAIDSLKKLRTFGSPSTAALSAYLLKQSDMFIGLGSSLIAFVVISIVIVCIAGLEDDIKPKPRRLPAKRKPVKRMVKPKSKASANDTS